jgi:predicted ATPase/transcriptional regulator with XRE-family HTH domain
VGELVRRHRVAAALSQEALAERAGLSARAVSDLERGVHQAPRLESLRLLADALGLDAAGRAELLAAARPVVAATESAPPLGRLRVDSLPLPPTRLIGREAEVAALSAFLSQSDIRLVTLTGAGGTGKTHLALTIAAAVRNRYPDGVCFVDLSPVTDPSLVVPTIAATLGVREIAGESLRVTLNRALRDRRLLVVLDNCEQVLAAAADVASLLAGAQLLAILATSREALRIRAEREVAVSPLSVPTPERLPPLDDLVRIPAVALFVERARAASVGFAVTADNAAAVAAICRRLDGLPLAIELAAARVKVLPPEALLARLEQRLPMLTGGGRDLPARQRTMRDAIAWSYDLLSPEEQSLFRRLAVFAGGFTLDAAAAVAPPDRERPVFDGVVALVDQSLVRQSPGIDVEPRYQMLETVREFGLEQLSLAGEMNDARERHATHLLRLAASSTGGFMLLSQDSLFRFAPERDNLMLALRWFDERDETEALLQLCSLAHGLWFALGLYREGLHWIERALERSGHDSSEGRLAVLGSAATLAIFQGDYTRAATLTGEELTLARELGSPLLLGRALTTAGLLAYRRGEYGQSEALLEEACRVQRRLVDSVPDPILRLGVALLERGDTALAQEQFDRAARRYEEALERYEPTHDYWGPLDAQTGLAGVSYCTGNRTRAVTLYVDVLNRARDAGITMLVASALNGLAGLAAESGQPETGALLLGAAEGIAKSAGAPLFPRDEPIRARALAALTAALGEAQLAAAREAGRALTVEEAVVEAMAVTEVARLAP